MDKATLDTLRLDLGRMHRQIEEAMDTLCKGLLDMNQKLAELESKPSEPLKET